MWGSVRQGLNKQQGSSLWRSIRRRALIVLQRATSALLATVAYSSLDSGVLVAAKRVAAAECSSLECNQASFSVVRIWHDIGCPPLYERFFHRSGLALAALAPAERQSYYNLLIARLPGSLREFSCLGKMARDCRIYHHRADLRLRFERLCRPDESLHAVGNVPTYEEFIAICLTLRSATRVAWGRSISRTSRKKNGIDDRCAGRNVFRAAVLYRMLWLRASGAGLFRSD